MNIHEPCFPLDPVDRICTEISNIVQQSDWSDPYADLRAKIFDEDYEDGLGKIDVEPIMDMVPGVKDREDLLDKCFWAVVKSKLDPSMNWSDVLGLVYHGKLTDYGDEYEKEILPKVKKRISSFDHCRYGHLPESPAYKE